MCHQQFEHGCQSEPLSLSLYIYIYGGHPNLASEAKLLPAKIALFAKITNFSHNSLKVPFFPGDFEGAKSIKNSKEKHSQGMIFVAILCQRALMLGSLPCFRACSGPPTGLS